MTVKRKIKYNKTDRNAAYGLMIKSMLYSMFDYKNIPFRSEFLEWELFNFGYVAIAKHDDEYYVGSLSFWDPDEAYGLPAEGSTGDFITRHGKTFKVTIGEDCVIGYNNSIRTPEAGLYYYPQILTEIDTSIDILVKKSRLNPIPVASNEQEKKAIANALERTEEGKTDVIVQNNILSELSDTAKGIPLISLTEPEEIERVQHLSKLHDDILRRGGTFYGHSLQSASKMAQVNEKELEGYDTFSMIYPLSLYKERKLLIDECNQVLGSNFSVTFSRAWKHLLEEERIEDVTEDIEDIDEEGGEEDEN